MRPARKATNKAGGKRSRKSSRGSSSKKTARKSVDLDNLHKQITSLVGNRAVEMVKTTMNEASKGHYLAMKYLFEMIGLSSVVGQEETLPDDSLAKTLLTRLGLEAEESLEVECAVAESADRVAAPVALAVIP